MRWSRCLWRYSHLSLELICRALANILAPMSPMAFPLMSNLVSEELLPRAFSTMVRSLFSLESARDRELRGWGREETREEVVFVFSDQQVKYNLIIWLYLCDGVIGQQDSCWLICKLPAVSAALLTPHPTEVGCVLWPCSATTHCNKHHGYVCHWERWHFQVLPTCFSALEFDNS